MDKHWKKITILFAIFYIVLFFALQAYVNAAECGGCGQRQCIKIFVGPNDWYWGTDDIRDYFNFC